MQIQWHWQTLELVSFTPALLTCSAECLKETVKETFSIVYYIYYSIAEYLTPDQPTS